MTRGSLPSGHCPGCPAAVCFPRVSGVEAVSPTAMVAPGRGQTVPTVRMLRAGAQMQGATHPMTGPQSTQLCQSPGLVRGCSTPRLPSIQSNLRRRKTRCRKGCLQEISQQVTGGSRILHAVTPLSAVSKFITSCNHHCINIYSQMIRCQAIQGERTVFSKWWKTGRPPAEE